MAPNMGAKSPAANIEAITDALRASWSYETTEEPENWTPQNSSRGQCGISALIINDFLGGKLVLWQVYVADELAGYHYSNQLPDGAFFDATSDQFWESEELRNPKIIERIAEFPKFGKDRYLLLRESVQRRLE